MPAGLRLPPALYVPDYRLFLGGLSGSLLSARMVDVALGWQVYAIHERALDLGLLGLVEFLPLPLLALPAGQLADRFPRRIIYAVSTSLYAVVSATLIAVSLGGANQLWPFLLLGAANGCAGAIGNPASRSLPPMLVEPRLLAGAFAVRTSVAQIAFVVGPATGGFLFAARP